MKIKQGLFAVLGSFLSCSLASAGDMGAILSSEGFKPVASLQGGYASLNAGSTQRFTGADANRYTYTNTAGNQNAGFIGVFLGAEHDFPWFSRPGLFMQTGVEYDYFGSTTTSGVNTVGIEPQTSTLYHYNYNFKTQQVLGTLKLFSTTYERYYPYGEVGLGAAFNRADGYQVTTTQTGSLNLTPTFNPQSQTQFSYTLGLGVDSQVNTKIRVGLGYRYSNFGSATLGQGQVKLNNYQSPVPFSIGGSNAYANQLIVRISYVA